MHGAWSLRLLAWGYVNAVVAEYRYSADSHRIAWRYPSKDGDNGWYYPAYDQSWRMIVLYKRNSTGTGTTLAERFFYNNAGLVGGGGASYVDSVIARDDLPIDDGSGSGTTILSRTSVYLQNWRGDVVSLLDPVTGRPREQVRYSAYGRPFSIPAGDPLSSLAPSPIARPDTQTRAASCPRRSGLLMLW